MKNTKKIFIIALTVFLLATAATPAFAQSETEPTQEPAATEEEETTLWTNPIVELLANFFSGLFTAPEPEETPPPEETPEGGETPEPADPTEEPNGDGDTEPAAEPTPTPSPQEAVSALHTEEDLGFGVMTKLMQMAVEANESCLNDGENCDVTLDSLVAEFKGGTGVGELFQKYGKPSMLGVGHVRKAAEDEENGLGQTFREQEKVKSNNGKAKGKNK